MMLPSLAMAAYSTTYSGIQKAPGFRRCRIAAAGSSRLFLILQFKLLIPLLMGSPNQARAGASPSQLSRRLLIHLIAAPGAEE